MIPAQKLNPNKTYDHAHHAGNVGDVWKHVVLAALCGTLKPEVAVEWIDTHAGSGRYNIQGAGEWDEGVVRLLHEKAPPQSVRTLLDQLQLREGKLRRYPGSPALAMALLGPKARLHFAELDPAAAARLKAVAETDSRAAVHQCDGFKLAEERAGTTPSHGRRIYVIDPPFADKDEWNRTAETVAKLAKRDPKCAVLAWYPIKGSTRPAFLRNFVRTAGVDAVALELITAPTDEKRNRLNGSGMLAYGLSPEATEEMALAGAWLGPRLALRRNHWSLRIIAGSEG
jgi:23S rRNA (adenine2030-N6)-methyltransferase